MGGIFSLEDRTASALRLIAGLLYLQHTFTCSDEDLL